MGLALRTSDLAVRWEEDKRPDSQNGSKWSLEKHIRHNVLHHYSAEQQTIQQILTASNTQLNLLTVTQCKTGLRLTISASLFTKIDQHDNVTRSVSSRYRGQ